MLDSGVWKAGPASNYNLPNFHLRCYGWFPIKNKKPRRSESGISIYLFYNLRDVECVWTLEIKSGKNPVKKSIERHRKHHCTKKRIPFEQIHYVYRFAIVKRVNVQIFEMC
jgi:hypothetical protein